MKSLGRRISSSERPPGAEPKVIQTLGQHRAGILRSGSLYGFGMEALVVGVYGLRVGV